MVRLVTLPTSSRCSLCWATDKNLSWDISFTSANFIMFLTFATSTAVCMSVLIISFPSHEPDRKYLTNKLLTSTRFVIV